MTLTDKELIEEFKLFRGELAGYAVSKDGRIYSLKSDSEVRVFDGPYNTKQVRMVGKTRYVHRLIAEAWIEKPSEKHNRVDFKDGDKSNIHYDNLVWKTHTEMTSKGNTIRKSTLEEADVLAIKKTYLHIISDGETDSIDAIKQIAGEYDRSVTTIKNVLKCTGYYSQFSDVHPWPIKTGDTVKIDNSTLASHGKSGTVQVVSIYKNMVTVKLDNGSITIKPSNLISV